MLIPNLVNGLPLATPATFLMIFAAVPLVMAHATIGFDTCATLGCCEVRNDFELPLPNATKSMHLACVTG